MARTKLYKCVGENYIDGVRLGFCGDIHTLDEWLEILFKSNIFEAKEYFEGDSDKTVIDYLYMSKGKRLKRYK